ncbi:MAG: hypothetical protein COU71_01540 [Parcubacteria group bacterium CG10_big_fil_rev_8_21_14_0_10_38_31]|nr:MAG: hypothetical protein COU71_01540 [Parcubacteria group bacterium CG10_big_fil_rev_8_21_14_0_10_38_31]
MLKRIIFDIVLLLSVFLSPWWWLPVILIVFSIFIFPHFWEAVVFGILIDSLIGVSSLTYLGGLSHWIFTLSFLIIILVINKFKKYLSFYK